MAVITANQQYSTQRLRRAPLLIAALTLAAIGWGWSQRDEYWLTAEHGLGYALGIVGALMMLLLLLYPLSKNSPLMRRLIATRYWFKAHMLMGIAGPLLILFHSNFGLGSVNSNVALFSMLLVVFSGLVGRYLYRRIHNGLYGQKLNYEELRAHHLLLKKQLQKVISTNNPLQTLFADIETMVGDNNNTIVHSFRKVWSVNSKSKKLYKQLEKACKNDPDESRLLVSMQGNIQKELSILQSMVGLSLYSRLFSLWHVVHLPFFYMLIITAIVHVIAVHMY